MIFVYTYPPAPPAIIERIPQVGMTIIQPAGEMPTVLMDGGDSGEDDSGADDSGDGE